MLFCCYTVTLLFVYSNSIFFCGAFKSLVCTEVYQEFILLVKISAFIVFCAGFILSDAGFIYLMQSDAGFIKSAVRD